MLPGTHLALALPAAVAFAPSIPAAAGFCVGSVLPDKLDFFIAGGSFETWSRIHRTWTHSWWAILLCLLPLVFLKAEPGLLQAALSAGRGCVLGMLYHVAWDSLTPMGIPLLWPTGSRRGLALVPARGMRSLMLCWAAIGLTIFLVWTKHATDIRYFASLIMEKAGSIPQASWLLNLFGK